MKRLIVMVLISILFVLATHVAEANVFVYIEKSSIILHEPCSDCAQDEEHTTGCVHACHGCHFSFSYAPFYHAVGIFEERSHDIFFLANDVSFYSRFIDTIDRPPRRA